MQKKLKKTEKIFKHTFSLFKKQPFSVKCTQAGIIDSTMSTSEQNNQIGKQLGVGTRTIQRWRSGVEIHPSAERLLFNMKSGIAQNGHWSGWKMHNNELVSPSGETVTPAIIGRLWLWRNERIAANSKIAELKRQVEQLESKAAPVDRDKIQQAYDLLSDAIATYPQNKITGTR